MSLEVRLLSDRSNKYKVDVTAIREIRWIGTGSIERSECNVIYCCHAKKHLQHVRNGTSR
jgi:hypothetical protein